MSLLPSLTGLPLAPPEVVDTEVKRWRGYEDSDSEEEHDYLPFGPLPSTPSVQARAVAPPPLGCAPVGCGRYRGYFCRPARLRVARADAD